MRLSCFFVTYLLLLCYPTFFTLSRDNLRANLAPAVPHPVGRTRFYYGSHSPATIPLSILLAAYCNSFIHAKPQQDSW